jgi:hypothetical protein
MNTDDDRLWVSPDDLFTDDVATVATSPEPSPDELREVWESDKGANLHLSHDGKPDRIIKPETIGDLIRRHPRMRSVVIDGMLRKGETMNLIAPPKVGKSWLSYSLALSVVTGREWLDSFACTPGKVLLLDNELHPETIAHRLPVVADALGITRPEYESDLHVVALRGRLLSLPQLDRVFDGLAAGEYQLVIGDAWYRFIPEGVSENDNAQIAGLFNRLDAYVSGVDCAWCGIHHTSRGPQAEKSVTDTGAGAGAQSRAADTHAVMRPHEDEGVIVFEAAVRSFPPLSPMALRWAFPLWLPDHGADPTLLKGRLTKGEQRTTERHAEAMKKLVDALRQGPATRRVLMAKTKLSRELCQTLLDRLEVDGQATYTTINKRGNETREYALKDVGD